MCIKSHWAKEAKLYIRVCEWVWWLSRENYVQGVHILNTTANHSYAGTEWTKRYSLFLYLLKLTFKDISHEYYFVKLHKEFMPTPVMTISDLTENINVTQSENKYHPPFHLKNLPKLAKHGWYLWRHKREKASKSRLRPIGNAQILRCTCVS